MKGKSSKVIQLIGGIFTAIGFITFAISGMTFNFAFIPLGFILFVLGGFVLAIGSSISVKNKRDTNSTRVEETFNKSLLAHENVSDKKKCSYCGTDFSSSQKSCPNCGAKD